MQDKPFSGACQRNRDPILAVLKTHFAHCQHVLEIGSGTGQHAVYFGAALPHVSWQTSDVPAYHAGIRQWLADEGTANVLPPLTLDVSKHWPDARFDGVFSANTLHIMGWLDVCAFFRNLPSVMTPRAQLVVYGPFHYQGEPTSESNARFDAQLRGQSGDMGIRNAEDVAALAAEVGLEWTADIAMPANNRCLVWQRGSG